MFSFLNTAVLFGLAAVALPFLIHLLNRQKAKRVVFSSLAFLRKLQHKKMRRMKLKQWLLLFLRALIVALLVLGFARPSLKTSSFLLKGTHSRTTAVLVLDNSMSMGAETAKGPLYSQAKSIALRVVQNLQNGDAIFILFTTKSQSIEITRNLYSVEKAQRLLKEEPLTYLVGNLDATLRRAVKLLKKSPNPNRELYVISDFQRSNFPRKLTPLVHDPTIRTYLFFLPTSDQPNVGFTRVKLLDQILEPNRPVKIRAVAKNYGRQSVQDVLLQTYLNGKRVAQNSLSLPAGASGRALFLLTPEKGNFQAGYVTLEDDPLLQDNRAYFSFFVPTETHILLIGNSQETRFVRLALAPGKTVSRNFVIRESPRLLAGRLSLEKTDVVILVDPPDFEPGAVDEIRQFLQNGGRLLLIPGGAASPRAYNENFLAPLNLPVFKETVGQPGQSQSYQTWGSINFKHPLFQGMFKEKHPAIESPHFFFSLKAGFSKRADEIIQYRNGSPFLLDIPVRKGRVFLFTGGLSPDWSDWAVKPIFAPLLYRSVSFLASTGNLQQKPLLVGDPLVFPLSEPQERLVVVKPDGQEVDVKPIARGGQPVVEFRDTEQPGIYTLYSGRTKKHVWAVNIHPQESNLEQLPVSEVKKLMGKNVWGLHPGQNFSQIIKESRFDRELTPYFLYAAFLFLLLEMILARTGKAHETEEESQ